MFGGGPTKLDREESFGREDATRKLLNRLKFGSESLLVTPFVYGAGKSAKLLANRGKDLAYSNSQFARWLDKYVRAPFTPQGGMTKELFGEEFEDGNISFGALERANKGTLLIDEVSEIPLETQSKILRVLTDQKFKRINGNHDIKVDVRIICSSAKDIKAEINNGNFREDLFHRLNVFQIDTYQTPDICCGETADRAK